ncbi:MAG: ABC-three component system protein [Phycisphaerales bacterium]
MSETVPLPTPTAPPALTADIAAAGPVIAPIERIRLFSPAQWEDFVLEWAHSLRTEYSRVDRCGGAGDMGRDVIAILDEADDSVWDNYQCKHYDHPLAPGDIWLELGKLVYFTHLGEFTYPRRYRFIAPQGVGTTLGKLLGKPADLKAQLIDKWDSKCRTSITSTEEVPLEGDLRAHLDSLDFSVIGYIPPLTLLEQHRQTPWHIARFGGGLPPRPPVPTPPANPAAIETVYLQKLFEAYANARGRTITSLNDIRAEADLVGHYSDSRLEFYSAESLRSFSRDTLPDGSFGDLQEEIHSGVRDVLRGEHPDGYRRLVAVVGTARTLQLTAHPLVPRMHTRDRGGVCHQLANDRDDVKWVVP